jgi:outer membrane receptor protein involved in Fe transport
MTPEIPFMSNTHRQPLLAQRHKDSRFSARPFSFRLTPIVAVVAGLCCANAAPLYAADDKVVTELQAEIARLKQALEKSQQELVTKKGSQAAPAITSTPATGSPSATSTATAISGKSDETQTLEAVVVRSRHRLERLQDVPVSVAVVTGKELERQGATDLDAITKRVANVSFNPGNARTSSLSIRGLGKQSQTDAMDPSVGVNVDGFAYTYNPLSSFDFVDVDAVEVLRGPQGTLFGKNATIGVINITTKRPTFKPEADYSLTLGQDHQLKASAAFGGPVVDDLLAWRGALSVSRGEGYIKNLYFSDNSSGNIDRVSGRVQFLLTPTPDFNARIMLELAPRTGESFNGKTIYTPTPIRYANGLANTQSKDASVLLERRWFKQTGYRYTSDFLYGGGSLDSVNLDNQTPTYTDSRGFSAELNWNIGSYKLTSITGYKDMGFQVRNDTDATPFDINKNGGGHLDMFRQYSEELRLSSPLGGFVDYQTGLFLAATSNRYDSAKGFGNDAGAWLASASQYTRLDTNGNGRYLMENSLNDMRTVPLQVIKNKSLALFGQANWHLTEQLTLTTGARFSMEDRKNTSSNLLNYNGYGGELNPYSVNGVLLGGFTATSGTNPTGGLLSACAAATIGDAACNSNNYGWVNLADPVQAARANIAAQKYFNVNYTALTPTQARQIADAKDIRSSNIGTLWNATTAEPFKKTQPSFVASPSYKINEDLTTYVSWQYGEKSGIAQVINGVSTQARPEKVNSYEWGFKSSLLNKTLTLNAGVFLSDIKDYQQSVQVVDAYTTSLKHDGSTYYTAATGNAERVRVTGLEFDGIYAGIKNTTIRFSGAYNNAIYKKFANSAQPVENGNLTAAFQDVSGQNLPGAAKYVFVFGPEYRAPVSNNQEFHTSLNTYFTSRYNSDNSLSSYGWIKGHSTTDFSIGLGRRDKGYDFTVLVKNLFDDKTPLAQAWNSYVPPAPRWIGLMFSGKL